MDYHAHIYFNSETRAKAESFRQKHQEKSNALALWVSSLVDRNVGPHPTPMFEVHVSTPTLADYIQFIEKENPGLSILLHEDTGEDYRDHTEGARWFGLPVSLDFNFFERVKHDDSIRIHPLKSGGESGSR